MATAPKNTAKKKEEPKSRGVFEKIPGSGIGWVRYFADGKKKREKVGRKSDAIALYQQRKSEIRAGVKLPSNLRRKGETLAVVIDRALVWYESHKPKSLRAAKTHLGAIKVDLASRVAADLTPGDVDAWIISHDSWSPATMNRYKATLGRALQLSLVSGHLQRNVARLVTARREDNTRVRWLKDDEEQRMVAAIQKNCPLQLSAFVVALHTGMRQSDGFAKHEILAVAMAKQSIANDDHHISDGSRRARCALHGIAGVEKVVGRKILDQIAHQALDQQRSDDGNGNVLGGVPGLAAHRGD
jgi:hypothetical protein